jgi:hypothetical protein
MDKDLQDRIAGTRKLLDRTLYPIFGKKIITYAMYLQIRCTIDELEAALELYEKKVITPPVNAVPMDPCEAILRHTGLSQDEYRKLCREAMVQDALRNFRNLYAEPVKELHVNFQEVPPKYVEYQRFEGIGFFIADLSLDDREFRRSLKKVREGTSALKTQLDYEGVIYPI